MENRLFYNEVLKEVSLMAKAEGLKVFTFQTAGHIKQIFLTDGKQIGTCQADFSGVRFSTVHKPSRECGTGFGLTDDHIVNVNFHDILESFKNYPLWATKKQREAVKKYASWEEYLKQNTILKYYQL